MEIQKYKYPLVKAENETKSPLISSDENIMDSAKENLSHAGNGCNELSVSQKMRMLETCKEPLKNTLNHSFQQSEPSTRANSSDTLDSGSSLPWEEKSKTLEKDLLACKRHNESLLEENRSLKDQLDLTNTRIKTLESMLRKVTEEKGSLTTALQKLQQEVGSAQVIQVSPRTTYGSSELEYLRKNLTQKNTEISDLRQKLLGTNRLQSECNGLRLELQRTKENLAKKSAQVDELTFKVRDLKNKEIENKELKKRYFLIRTASQMLQPRIHSLNTQIDLMQKMIKFDEVLDLEIELRKLLDERDILASQNQRLRAPFEKVLKDVENFKEQIKARIDSFDELKSSFEQKNENDVRPGGESGEKCLLLKEKKDELVGIQIHLAKFDEIKKVMDQMAKDLRKIQNRLVMGLSDSEIIE